MAKHRSRRYPVFLFALILCALGPASPALLDTIATVAGSGAPGFSGDGGPAADATLNRPAAVTMDRRGNLYIADTDNHRIRKVTPDGIIATVAGNGTPEYTGDGGPATDAGLNTPHGLYADAEGVLYIADTRNHRIRKVTPDGIIATVAGNGTETYSGDGGPATNAGVNRPHGVFIDRRGNLLIADTNNGRVRKVDPSGAIATLAGNGTPGFSGDGGPATNAALNGPIDVLADSLGAIYISDRSNDRIRKVDPSGAIATLAGNGAPGFSGDGGPATNAALNGPRAIAMDGQGALYIVDMKNQRIRRVDPSGIISTLAGNGARGASGDGGPATDATLDLPRGVAAGIDGAVYIADRANNRVRKVAEGDAPPPQEEPPQEEPPIQPSPDFNGDGRVDFADFVAFARRYNAARGEQNYDSKFDLDSDGKIGFSDFLRFAAAYGR